MSLVELVRDPVQAHSFVEIRDLHKAWGENLVLRGVDLDIGRGEVVVIMGPSGSGKSTLLRCINNLEHWDSGRITVEGLQIGYRRSGDVLREKSDREAALERREIGMVFQQFNLFPLKTVIDNITLAPIHVLGKRKPDAESQAIGLLDQVGLASKAHAYPFQLSGGQKQRVAIARALAMSPKLMLFDEPTSALDPELVGEVLEVMKSLAREGLTMAVVTHELGFAREVGTKLVFLDGGVIVEEGDPREMIANPKTDRARRFIESVI